MDTTSVAKTKGFKEFLQSPSMDRVVTFQSTASSGGRRYWPGDESMDIRFIKRKNKSGQYDVWATSLLEKTEHPKQALLDIYARRWKIETAIKETKEMHGFEEFHARTVNGIYQEVTAVFLFMYIKSELEAEARERYFEEMKKKDVDLPEPISSAADITELPFRFHRGLVGDMVVELMYLAARNDIHGMRTEWEDTLDYIWRCRQKVREGRSYERRCKSPIGKSKRRGKWAGP